MDQWLLQYYEQFGENWNTIQNKFLSDRKINILNTQILKNRCTMLNGQSSKQKITLTKEESDMTWLVAVKACSCKLPVQQVWQRNTLARNLDSSTLRSEFVKLFKQGLLQINTISGADLQKNAQIIKTLSDSTILLSIRVIREEVKDQLFNQMRQDFQRMLTVITYVLLSKTIKNESILSFCSIEQYENILSHLSKLDQMRLLSLKGDQLIDPLQKTYTYAKLFIKQPPIFDPFKETEEGFSSDLGVKKVERNNQIQNPLTLNRDVVIDDGFSISLDKQEDEDDSGSYDIDNLSQ